MKQKYWSLVITVLMAALLPVMSVQGQSTGVCRGFKSRLEVGMDARVTPGPANNLRSAPDKQSQLLGKLDGGEDFFVIDGPVCEDNITYWRVRDYDRAGWTGEGQGSTYWIEPWGTQEVDEDVITLPADVLAGLSFGGGGGGGDYYPCEFEPPLNGWFVSYFTYNETEHGTTLAELSTEIAFAQTNFALVLCNYDGSRATTAHLVSPKGKNYTLDVYSSENFSDDEVYGSYKEIPVCQYLCQDLNYEAGSWELTIDDEILYFTVPSVSGPAYDLWDTSILTGFQPNEEVLIFESSGTSLGYTYSLYKADKSGLIYNSQGALFAVGNKGSSYDLGMGGGWFQLSPDCVISLDSAMRQIADYYWDDEPFDVSNETCY